MPSVIEPPAIVTGTGSSVAVVGIEDALGVDHELAAARLGQPALEA